MKLKNSKGRFAKNRISVCFLAFIAILALMAWAGTKEIKKEVSIEIAEQKLSVTNRLPQSADASVKQIITNVAGQGNFKYTSYLLRLAYCESRFDPTRTNDNGEFGIDRGLFQINNHFHPEVTDEQAVDVIYATKWTMKRILAGEQHEWACDKLVKGHFNYIAKNK